MIVTIPPQDRQVSDSRYVLLCAEATYPLTFTEALRACGLARVEFRGWHSLTPEEKHTAAACVREADELDKLVTAHA